MNNTHTYKKNVFPSKPKAACIAVLSGIMMSSPALAGQQTAGGAEQVKLKDVVVKAQKRVSRKDTEITGLGKVVKNADALSKEQVLNIRDLTRYDPGIAVVEQGRGASSGYSIRGMDRNRVGFKVDGLPQIQSYTIDRSSASSGAINEIEYENIQAVEFSKGANSAEQGNGSLGGSVSFRTKEAGDVIKEDQNWGLDTKTAYSSKNRQSVNSVAAAGRLNNGLEGLLVYTHRNGSETRVHPHAGRHTVEVERQAANPTTSQYGWFALEGECAAPAGCAAARPVAQAGPADVVLESMAAKDYTGNKRILPDPMDYQSHSWLLKTGYRFSPNHYLGGVLEHTKQRYDIRDTTFEQYWTAAKTHNPKEFAQGIYLPGESLLSGLAVPDNEKIAAGMQYSRLRYFDERHRKSRYGLHYRYENPDKNGWIDNFKAGFDIQDISLDSHRRRLHCSVYPHVDKNCRADTAKPWSLYESERNNYGERHNLLQLSAGKKWQFDRHKHDIRADFGWDKFKSTVERKEFFRENAQVDIEIINSANGTQNNPFIYRIYNPRIFRQNVCRYDGITAGVIGCDPRIITGHNYHLALRDHMSLGKYVDWGLGARYDYRKIRSNDSWTAGGTFKNFSWNSGFVLKPTANLSFSHRISNGFRLPSFQELFGIRVDGFEKGKNDNDHYVGKFKPEKALNNEFGIHLKGGFGSFETSYFRNHYKDLIAVSEISIHAPGFTEKERGIGYRNAQTVKLDGFNVLGKIDWNAVYGKLPEGLYSTLAYNRIRLKQAQLAHNHFSYVYSPLLDAIQPSRYVLGLGYDHPSGKWGLNTAATYSKAKNPDELKGINIVGFRTYEEKATAGSTKSWYTFDVSGYVTLKDKFTLRAGIYNLANRRYSQWESVRQSALGAVNRQKDVGDYARYAAPGRNATVSLEMKF